MSCVPFFIGVAGAQVLETLPEENSGIAAKYPGDRGIAEDPAVIFAENFESYSSTADLRRNWDVLTHVDQISIAEGEGNVHSGSKSLLFTMPQQNQPLTASLEKTLPAGQTQDTMFLRWYMKYESDWFIPRNSVHNGAVIAAKYYDNGRATPGIPANGQNKFLVNYECENAVGASPGKLNFYVYHAEQAGRFGDSFYPSGTVNPRSATRSGKATFGEQFVSRPDFLPQLGRWYCYECMVKANTPGKRDGRLAMWVDGKLIGDFPSIRFRDVDDLKIDRFGMMLYIARNSSRVNRKWHDDVVAAKSYIGPIFGTK
jgi:hypothetical protein